MLAGKKVMSNGILQLGEKDSVKLYIPGMKRSFDVTGLSDCQIVYGNEVLFVGIFNSETEIALKAIDDLPTPDVCNDMGVNFMAILNFEDTYVAALRSELCSVKAEDGHVVISCTIHNENVTANIGEVPKIDVNDEDALSDWFYKDENSVIIINSDAKNVTVDKEAGKLEFLSAKYKFV